VLCLIVTELFRARYKARLTKSLETKDVKDRP